VIAGGGPLMSWIKSKPINFIREPKYSWIQVRLAT
jgi:hypothetical protein